MKKFLDVPVFSREPCAENSSRLGEPLSSLLCWILTCVPSFEFYRVLTIIYSRALPTYGLSWLTVYLVDSAVWEAAQICWGLYLPVVVMGECLLI